MIHTLYVAISSVSYFLHCPLLLSTGVPRPPTITEHPSDTTVAPGTSASFSCSASGQPSPQFSWYHDGTLLTSVEVSTSGGRSTLSVGGVGEGEEGEYHCQAHNSQGTVNSEPAQLHLAYEYNIINNVYMCIIMLIE